jgi:hypothetical protein
MYVCMYVNKYENKACKYEFRRLLASIHSARDSLDHETPSIKIISTFLAHLSRKVLALSSATFRRVSETPRLYSLRQNLTTSPSNFHFTFATSQKIQSTCIIDKSVSDLLYSDSHETYVVCLKSSVNGTRKQTKQKIQTN